MSTFEKTVRGFHLDGFQHVNNARYLEFLEEARWAMFDNRLDLEALAGDGYAFTVVNININYRSPALIHDRLIIESHVSKWGSRSAVIRQEITHKDTGRRVADADVTFVMVDIHKQKTAAMTGPLLERLQSALAHPDTPF